MAKNGILTAVRRGHGGAKVKHHKNTADCPVVTMAPPARVVLPMSQHIGAPCVPTVKVGDSVAVGQVIGDSDKFVSAPIHATVSGTVKAVEDYTLPNGMETKAVVIESDGEMRVFEGIAPPTVTNKAELCAAVRQSGLVGLGGAGFPTHVKLNTPPDKPIDTLIINAAECEPFITVDYRECIDNTWDVLNGVYTVKELLGIPNVVIAVEDNKPEAIRQLKKIAEHEMDIGDHVKVMTLKSKYPQGAEKMMVLSATGREMPPGKLPADVGCMVMNVASAAFISRYLKTGMPLVSRCLTVDGTAIAKPQNVQVPIGTSIQEIIDFCGGFTTAPGKILAGGPMMGNALMKTDIPIVKANNAILAFAEPMVKRETDCIRCGRCAAACPMHLTPTALTQLAKNKDAEALERSGIMVCMECGSCAFVCPAGKPLVQLLRLGKTVVKEAKQA